MNQSTVLTDAEVQAVVAPLQQQVRGDFFNVWGIDAGMDFVPADQPPAGAWWLTVFDDPDQASALGSHDITSEGLPLGKVFARSDLQTGSNWTVTASHEQLEMLADPEIKLTIFQQTDAFTGILYAFEVCHACEADDYGYMIGDTLVPDFVYPEWFQPSRTAALPFDREKKITASLELLPGGYIGVFDASLSPARQSRFRGQLSRIHPLRAAASVACLSPHVISGRECRYKHAPGGIGAEKLNGVKC